MMISFSSTAALSRLLRAAFSVVIGRFASLSLVHVLAITRTALTCKKVTGERSSYMVMDGEGSAKSVTRNVGIRHGAALSMFRHYPIGRARECIENCHLCILIEHKI